MVMRGHPLHTSMLRGSAALFISPDGRATVESGATLRRKLGAYIQLFY
jgi:hypothetical protein